MDRRVLSIAVVLLVVLSVALAACAAPTTPKPQPAAATQAPAKTEPTAAPKPAAADAPVELTLTMWGSQLDVDTYTKRAELVHKKYPNITIKVIHVPTDYAQKVQTMIAGGTAPDIMEFAEDVHVYSAKGQIIPLDEYVKKYDVDVKSRFAPAMIDWFTYQGKLYAMPDRAGAMIVYYNKAMFDKAGVKYPSNGWTWQDFLDAAKKLTIRDASGKVTQYGFANISWWPYWMSMVYQNGGRMLDANGKPVMNSPQNIEAIRWYNDLVYVHKVSPSPEDYANMGNPGPDQLFAQKKLAMEWTGFWNLQSLKDVPDLDWDIAPLPRNKQGGVPVFGNGLAISKQCKNPEAAFRAIEFMTSLEGQMPIVESFEDAPANLQAQSSTAFLKPFPNKSINMGAFKESADALFAPFHPKWNEIMKIVDDNLSEVWLNKKDVKVALDKIQADLTELLK